jgi:ABC-2 type transport system ATP-binding protein
LADAGRLEEARVLLAECLGDEVNAGADGEVLSARVSHEERVPEALAVLTRHDITVREFALAQPSLDDVFFALTGHAAEEEASREEVA